MSPRPPSLPPRLPPLRKALGQHHLVDGALTRPLVSFLAPRGERVIEVGPGGGVLTAELLAAGARRVVAWELDTAWAAAARRRVVPVADPGRLDLVVGDALAIPWASLPAPTLAAGNLPYQIATALISRLLSAGERVPRAAFLVQWEVAERLVARPREAAYGALSVLVAAWSRAELLGRVKRGSFRPPPQVEGAFVGFTLQPPPLPRPAMEVFTAFVRTGFAQRRKTLVNALAAAYGKARAAAAVAAVGLPPKVRAEELGLEELVELYRGLGDG